MSRLTRLDADLPVVAEVGREGVPDGAETGIGGAVDDCHASSEDGGPMELLRHDYPNRPGRDGVVVVTPADGRLSAGAGGLHRAVGAR